MRGLALVAYGSDGIGKTSWALRFPKPVVCLSCKEEGYADLMLIDDVPQDCENINITDYSQLNANIREIESGTIVIDSTSGLQGLIFEYVCQTQHKGNWYNFTNFWKGQRIDCPPVLQETLDLCNIAREKGVHVIFLGHMATESQPNSFGADYLSHVILMDDGDKGGIRSTLMHWAQGVLFMTINIDVDRTTIADKTTKLTLEGKAKDKDTRIMYTTKSPGHNAKNRLNLPPIISMGESADEAFSNFWKRLPISITGPKG